MEKNNRESNSAQKTIDEIVDSFMPKYDSQIEREIINNGQNSIVIDYNDVPSELIALMDSDFDSVREFLCAGLLHRLYILNPTEYTEMLSKRGKLLIIRINNLPHIYSILDLNSNMIGRFIGVNCIIVRSTNILPMIKKAMFKCTKCDEVQEIEQKDLKLKYPNYCECRNYRFDLLMEHSTFEDTQILMIQENPEENSENTNPTKIVIRLPPNLVNFARAGDRVNIYGIMKPTVENGKTRIFQFTFDVNNIEVLGETIRNPEISDDERKQIEVLSKLPNIEDKFIESIAPSIYGYPDIKLGLALLLFGGVSKTLPDGVKIRGDIHTLIIGDPGTAKSVLLKYTQSLSPRGIYAVGGGSSGVGLTASVVREKGEENFTLEAGTMVLANGGIACIDELDKMRDEDRGKIHEAMVQQTVTVAKGGIRAILPARCSVLAASNPKDGRYDFYRTVKENITFPPTLMTRFDLVWIIKDIPEIVRDGLITDHMLSTQTDNKYSIPPISPLLLKKYISIAKKINPKIGLEASFLIKTFYGGLRNMSSDTTGRTPMSITPRQLESIIRLTEASARMHLRSEANDEDAKIAINLLQLSLQQIGFDPVGGVVDIDQAEGRLPKSIRDKRVRLLQLMDDMTMGTYSGLTQKEIYDEAEKILGLKNNDDLDRLLIELANDGLIKNVKSLTGHLKWARVKGT